MGASIVAGMNASPVFELAEHILDFVTLAIITTPEAFLLRR
jgi:hypothetical protein